ncbi:cytochrome c peroxidase [Flagellimonas sp. DF-77]|uniref:cytochrome-c peroxidase n=1 Tax=Flagellimonas algarum TaxID=3230298 RepID=UPI003396CA2D
MKTNRFLIYGCTLWFLFSCQKDDGVEPNDTTSAENELSETIVSLFGSLEALTLPNSSDYLDIPSDANNPITAEKVALGQFLFHETELGIVPRSDIGTTTYACASCHHAKAGFQSGMLQGIGEGGVGFGILGEARTADPAYNQADIDVQPIRSPTILNTAYQDVMLWNGQFGATGTNSGTEANWTPGTPKERNNLGFQGVEIQAIAGMGVHRLDVSPDLVENGPYRELFDAAFPNVPEANRYSLINAGLAIAAFERTVLANEAPFQLFLKGQSGQLDTDELAGGLLFFGKGKCFECHSGPGLNGMSFHALGMDDFPEGSIIGTVDDATRRGRGGFTDNPEDDYAFKTPTLYNLRELEFFGHGGSFNGVREVIAYKNLAERQNNSVPVERLAAQFVPLELTDTEIDQLTKFVENALFDPNLQRYQPTATPMGTSCFPNADSQSILDQDCD